MPLRAISFAFFAATTLLSSAVSQEPFKFVANYDESKIPAYELPALLESGDGSKIQNAQQWQQRRREILTLFEDHVFGVVPDERRVEAEVVRTDHDYRPGVTRFEFDVIIHPIAESTVGEQTSIQPLRLQVLADVPQSTEPAPAILGLNFQGNHTIDSDPQTRITESWVRDRRNSSTDGNRAIEGGRGVASSRWPSELITQRGYALVTLYYGDIDPDYDDGFENGIHGTLRPFIQQLPANKRPGSIAGWSYGLSCVLDAIEQLSELNIDPKRVGVLGHSRLGKTALWAGATDTRFAMVISNDSGCGGAALSRRAFGETVGRINRSFPHWFNDQYTQYNENESAMPVDQHQLIALAAPRPIAVGSATQDEWADPKGEFLSWQLAAPAYRVLGMNAKAFDTVSTAKMLKQQGVINAGPMQYHLREGKHDLAKYDWECYLDLADRTLSQSTP
ncbi:alpha/beta hydrolase family protein [Rhodopirellula halodulae]|uniref:alpha/beta hydrolase family protein n=1 Tax=Rhodopirellula halodulae TaxID=2894198 RepID=UPI001E544C1D|nr:acetylxylan esterase [Rhodopirellula sp. JC737]MCC9658928.1 acetylxylan esterase [Rhodopirellula sp. JC737]